MIVKYDRSAGQIHLEPQNETDDLTLRRLIEDDRTIGCGFVPHTTRPAHCQVAIQEQED